MITTRVIDTHRLSIVAAACEREMTRFFRDLSAGPTGLAPRIRAEMEKAGFDEIREEPNGGIQGRFGTGRSVILLDCRARAAGIAAGVYAVKLIHELGLYGDYTLWVAEQTPADLHADGVLVTEPTGLRILKGHRGRVEIAETHPLVKAAIDTYETLFELPPIIGPGPAAVRGLSTIAFGPARDEIVKAAQFYAVFPLLYASRR